MPDENGRVVANQERPDVLDEDRPGVSLVRLPLPNGVVSFDEPSEYRVIVPDPNVEVVPDLVVLPSLSLSFVRLPLPNGVVSFDEPSE